MNKLPEKWFVLYSTREEFNKINKHYAKDWVYMDMIESPHYHGYHNGDFTNNWVGGEYSAADLLSMGFDVITFSDFQRLVINENDTEELIEII